MGALHALHIVLIVDFITLSNSLCFSYRESELIPTSLRIKYFSRDIRLIMFAWLFGPPEARLRKQYDAKLEQAMLAQRRGDMKSFAFLSQEAEGIWKKIEAFEK